MTNSYQANGRCRCHSTPPVGIPRNGVIWSHAYCPNRFLEACVDQKRLIASYVALIEFFDKNPASRSLNEVIRFFSQIDSAVYEDLLDTRKIRTMLRSLSTTVLYPHMFAERGRILVDILPQRGSFPTPDGILAASAFREVLAGLKASGFSSTDECDSC